MSIADKARKIPGVAAAEGAITGAVATEHDLPIADYDKQTAEDIVARLNDLTQRELRMVGAYETKHQNRATITDKIAKLSAETHRNVLAYERDRKNRTGVIDAANR